MKSDNNNAMIIGWLLLLSIAVFLQSITVFNLKQEIRQYQKKQEIIVRMEAINPTMIAMVCHKGRCVIRSLEDSMADVAFF